jgi:hypothetical protein
MFGYELKWTNLDQEKTFNEVKKKQKDKEYQIKIPKNYSEYLSNPSEIMAYAFSVAHSKKHKDVDDNAFGVEMLYDSIGGNVNELFLKYVDFYKKNI